MAWSNSKVFSAFWTDKANQTTLMDLNSDTFKVALFDNTITPSQTVASASTAFGAGVWASGEVFQAVQWPTAGVALAGVASGFSSNVYTFDANDTASGSAFTTTSDVYGVLVYSDTITTPVADQGLCYNYLGGPQAVTAGILTIQWSASGITYLTL